jgi:methylamine---corrinoid protein Co-methyltransferase
MDLGQANALVLALLEKYEPVFKLAGGNPGVSFEHAYDLNTLQPIPEWQRMYEEVKAEMNRMGLIIP